MIWQGTESTELIEQSNYSIMLHAQIVKNMKSLGGNPLLRYIWEEIQLISERWISI